VIRVSDQSRGQEDWVVVPDLARFSELRRSRSDGALPIEPELVLEQADDPLRAPPGR
jgi:hypothetical protein